MRSPFLFSTIQDYEINNNITKLARTQGKDQITNENLINTDGMFLTAQFKNISIYGYIYSVTISQRQKKLFRGQNYKISQFNTS